MTSPQPASLCQQSYLTFIKTCRHEALLHLLSHGLTRQWIEPHDAQTLLKTRGGRFAHLNLDQVQQHFGPSAQSVKPSKKK